MITAQEPMTGVGIRLDAAAKAAIVNALADKMKLRQWCVEQAIKVASVPVIFPFPEGECDGEEKAGDDIAIHIAKELTKFFYDFVTTTEEKTDDAKTS